MSAVPSPFEEPAPPVHTAPTCQELEAEDPFGDVFLLVDDVRGPDEGFEAKRFEQSLVRRDDGSLTWSTRLTLESGQEGFEQIRQHAVDGSLLASGQNRVRIEMRTTNGSRSVARFSVVLGEVSLTLASTSAYEACRRPNSMDSIELKPPTVSFDLEFEKVDWLYRGVAPNGTLLPEERVRWDRATERGETFRPASLVLTYGPVTVDEGIPVSTFTPPWPLTGQAVGLGKFVLEGGTRSSLELLSAVLTDRAIPAVQASISHDLSTDEFDFTNLRVRSVSLRGWGMGCSFTADRMAWAVGAGTGTYP